MEYLGLGNKEFSTETGISESQVSRMRSNKQEPGSSAMGKITMAYPQLNLRWLIIGEGEMLADRLSEEEQELLKYFRDASEDLGERTDFRIRVQFFWHEFQELQLLMDRLKLIAPELESSKKRLLKWHLWEYQERRRWLDVHLFYIKRQVQEGRLSADTTEIKDVEKQVEDIEEKIKLWHRLESEEAKKIMEE